ncbi:class I SAM-dependent methyltransferase [Streptomyces sp. enrichment culture]|uniref:class I SAM-dependent methyltransferase n=1 Tax=Streptomyces sp. enrichment culture TaxID=1795815 RepID=UPI003F54A72B
MESSPVSASVRRLGSSSATEAELTGMVRAHYDSEPMLRLAGEIHFDAELSRAEVRAAARVYGGPLPELVYLPCAGTLRHAAPLLAAGARQVVAVDLSGPSLTAGLGRNVPAGLRGRVTAYRGDVRDAGPVLPDDGVRLAFLGGNSLGDITAPAGHRQFLHALARSLSAGGVLVFDYVSDRYLPAGTGPTTSEWPQVWHGPEGDVDVVDRRTRTCRPLGTSGMALLSIRCDILDLRTRRPLVPAHTYSKLIVPDPLLKEQCAEAGLELTNAGPVADWSHYHRDRIDQVDDLGMMGEPDCWYRAVRP